MQFSSYGRSSTASSIGSRQLTCTYQSWVHLYNGTIVHVWYNTHAWVNACIGEHEQEHAFHRSGPIENIQTQTNKYYVDKIPQYCSQPCRTNSSISNHKFATLIHWYDKSKGTMCPTPMCQKYLDPPILGDACRQISSCYRRVHFLTLNSNTDPLLMLMLAIILQQEVDLSGHFFDSHRTSFFSLFNFFRREIFFYFITYFWFYVSVKCIQESFLDYE